MKIVTTAAIGAVALTAPFAVPGCNRPMTQVTWEMNGVPAHDHPHQAWWRYQFVYHPHEQVYFEPYTKTYYWFVGDQWEEGLVLPEWIVLDHGNAEIVKLQEPKPYVQHYAVMKWSWPHSKPRTGSLDAYHSTPEAIAASELRATMRGGFDVREVKGGDNPWQPVSSDLQLMEPMSDASDSTDSPDQPFDPFMGVDATSEMNDAQKAAAARAKSLQETADAMAELNANAADAETDSEMDSTEDDEFFTVVDPMAEGDPDH